LGLFSLAVLMAKVLHPQALPVQQSRWYSKEEATFSDVLAAVRMHLWSSMNYAHSRENEPMCLIPHAIWSRIQQVACYTT
jgi:hypothetical protein